MRSWRAIQKAASGWTKIRNLGFVACAVVFVLLVPIVGCCLRYFFKEPTYDERPLSYWVLVNYTNRHYMALDPAEKELRREASALALRGIGSKGTPYIMGWFAYKRPKWKDKVESLEPYLPLSGEFWWNVKMRLNRKDQLHAAALDAIETLGGIAGPLATQLHSLAKKSSDPKTRDRLLVVLAHLEERGLARLKTDLEDGSLNEAYNACKALWMSQADNIDISTLVPSLLLYEARCSEAGETTIVAPCAGKYLPAIVACATNANAMIRAAAIQQLGGMTYRYPDAIPPIKCALEDCDTRVQFAATNALSNALLASEKAWEDSLPNGPHSADMFGYWVGASKSHYRLTLQQHASRNSQQ